MQLFLLHFAGGNCYSYDFLRNDLKSKIDFYALELPGRGKRYKENLLLSKEDAIMDYVKQIKNLRNKTPYIIFGHSMGAILGFSVANHMEKEGDPPVSLVVSGHSGPRIKEKDQEEDNTKKKKYHLMNDRDFKERLRKMGGMPDEILENSELYNFFAPVLRADFAILEKGKSPENKVKIDSSIYAIMGDQEKNVENIENWKEFTKSGFRSQILKGNHFFINNHSKKIANIITNCFEQVLTNQ
ncbi:alpha/beta fold hydrolase [Aquimarina gracilis]|uniref:Alpha/beta fold hydrolase n=1 Tax=Aquimarina gracilis TaxID=874422 RepID=A0ABU5ZTT7_9FLAO|nr:alpha/beta fold hydrolase [Aquimarina gracilis]MEB3344957.1 alpha/beta fold hydrolase [Aquimarina gracilis]